MVKSEANPKTVSNNVSKAVGTVLGRVVTVLGLGETSPIDGIVNHLKYSRGLMAFRLPFRIGQCMEMKGTHE